MASVAALPSDFKPLLGTDETSIDEKGRIIVGKKKRDRLGETFVIVLSPTNCLVAYHEEIWDAMVKDILSHDSINTGTEEYTRLMLGNAEDEIKFDAQGRFVVPQRLRTIAKLRDKVTLVGCGNRLEIWASDEYADFLASPENYKVVRRQALDKAYRQMKGL